MTIYDVAFRLYVTSHFDEEVISRNSFVVELVENNGGLIEYLKDNYSELVEKYENCTNFKYYYNIGGSCGPLDYVAVSKFILGFTDKVDFNKDIENTNTQKLQSYYESRLKHWDQVLGEANFETLSELFNISFEEMWESCKQNILDAEMR